MANLLSTNVSGRLYVSTYSDVNPTNGAFRFYDGTTFRGGLGLDSWAHSGSSNDLNLYVANDSTLWITTNSIKRHYFNSGEAAFRTYAPDLNYKISFIAGDQFNAYYGDNATTMYVNWNGGTTRFGGEGRFNGSLYSSSYVWAENAAIRIGEIWGYGGIYRSEGSMIFGVEGGAGWSFRAGNSEKVWIGNDGNIYMAWAGAYISTLLDAKQNASTAITTSNIGSQSVSYASSAGNADTLDGYHSNTVGNRHHTARGFTVGGDENTYYPVTFGGSGAYAFNRYSIYRYYQWTAPWDPIGTGYHRGGLTFDFEWSGDIAWGGNDHTLRVIQFSEQYTSQVGGLALPVSQGVCVWLRGGTSYYEIQVDAYPVDVVVHLEGFTAGSGTFYGPREDTSNVQSEIYNRMPVRNSSELYDGGSRVIHVGGDQTKSGYLQSNSSLRAPIFYDSNDTTYYLDPNSTSRLHIIKLSTDQWNQSSDGYSRFYFGNNARTYFGSGNGYEFRSAADVNIASISNAGDFVAAGDVTAYSDARIKENVHTIENALDKTLQLRGVTYNRTDSEDKSTKVGVIAQEILEVIPEVVKQNDEGMYSVSYGNLTAVLIEAIKEQQKQIDELKEIINGLTK